MKHSRLTLTGRYFRPKLLTDLRLYIRIFLISLLFVCQGSQAQTDDDDMLLFISVITAAAKNKNPPPPKPEPVDLCQGYRLNDKTNRPMTTLARPQKGDSYTDPQFASKITRITDSSTIASGIIKTMYNTIQAWNADESRLILWHRGDGHHLYHGRNYSHIEKLNISPSDLEQVFWSANNKNTLIYPNAASGQVVKTANGNVTLQGNELIEYNIANKTYRVIRDFNSHCPADTITAGNDVQIISYNDDVIGLRCGDLGFVYKRSLNRISNLPGSSNSVAPQPFPSGELVYHQGNIYDGNLNLLRSLDLGTTGEHANLGRLHNGADALFATAFDANTGNSCGNGIGSLVIHDATTADCRVLVGPATGYPYTLSGTHPSALAVQNPGWAVVSSIGYGTEGDSLLEQELYLANTDPANPKVCRIAHHRATGRKGSIGYFAEPHPVLSPTGTRVLFSSDWSDSGTVDVYVVEMPTYTR